MHKFDKGLAKDIRPQEQPDGTYPFAKNGVQLLHGVTTNEPGFLPSSAVIPYTPIGLIETSKFPVVVSTDNVNSAFGYFDEKNDVYTPIFNDATKSFKLGLNLQWYVTGQAQLNYKGEVIIACTDRHIFPMFLNCDVPVADALDDLRLFPKAQRPEITNTVIENGGILLPGAYYVLGKYGKFDGTETSYLISSDVIIIAGTAGVNTGKGLQIEVRNADPNFDLIQIGIISKVAGVVTALTMEPATLSASGAATLVYSGSNLTTVATLEELLVDPVTYTKVQCMGQLNDALYIGNMEREPEIRMQKHALLVNLRFVSKLVSVFPRDEDHANARQRSFRHQEVYAFYIRYSITTGGWTQLNVIAGLTPTSGDMSLSAEASVGGMVGLKFQVEDTIHSFDAINKKGTLGVWQNDDETYPDTDDYDASSIGGRNLRGQKVLHHRFPSIGWCKENLYSFDDTYGKNRLDLMGIEVTNVVIPTELKDRLDGGYEIYFAKRNTSNSTVLGQSLMLFGARAGKLDGTITGPDNEYVSTGGNWNSQIDWEGSNRERPLTIDQRLFRFHDFDILFNRPAIAPVFLSFQLKHKRVDLPATFGLLEDFYIPPGHRNGPIAYLLDYISRGMPPLAVAAGKKIRHISEYQYVPNNLFVGKWKNIQLETVFAGRIEGPPMLAQNEISETSLWTGRVSQRPDLVAQFETTFLVNMMSMNQNLYLPFNSQPVARCGVRQVGNSTLFGGDSFVVDYTFHTYGWLDQNNDTYAEDSASAEFMGIKTVRRFACESSSNLYSRFEIPGDIYSRYYPVSPLSNYTETAANSNYTNALSRNFDPNHFGYNKDSNALNDLITAVIFNPQREDIHTHPFRVHRGGKLNRQLKKRSWRTFLPLDYYECQKNMGVIINLEGMDDRLFIHHEKALFFTQDKLKLEQGVLAVTLGSADIFQFEPQEGLATKLGYAGTQHQLACVRSPLGYIFVDSLQGQMFIFKGELRLINEYLNRFLEKYLKVTGINPFIGDGITIGYDPQYKRIMLTVKKLVYPTGVKLLQFTQAFIDTLTPDVSLVNYHGRLLKFLGPNTTEYDCFSRPPVEAPDGSVTIPEDTPVGSNIYSAGATSGENLSFYIVGGNLDNTFSVNASTGMITLVNQAGIDYEVRHQFILQMKAVDPDGQFALYLITVNITNVNEPPVTGDFEFAILENVANGAAVGTVMASDPEHAPLTYAITSGNNDGVFVINPTTGAITVANNTTVDAETTNLYVLSVNVSDGVNTVASTVLVHVTSIDEPPPLNDDTITIYDTTPTSYLVYTFFTRDPEGTAVRYEIVSATVDGIFSLDLTTGRLTLVDNALLNPQTTPQIILVVRAIDATEQQDTGTLTINVVYDPVTLQFLPGSGVCSGGCPIGWTETADGLQCERLTTIPATPPTGGPPISVVAATNGAYGNFGAVIYDNIYNGHGVGTVTQWMQNSPVWKNIATNLLDGMLNRAGVWGSTPVPDDEPIGFSIPITILVTKTFLVAIAGDNKCRIAVNGVTIVDQNPTEIGDSLEVQLGLTGQGIALAFKITHIYQVTLTAGTSYIGLEGVNFGSAAAFAAEIYDNTVAEVMAATLKTAYTTDPTGFPLNQNYYNNLNLVFTTRSARGGTFTSGISGGYSCPVGYALDGTAVPIPNCVQVERQPAITKLWTITQVKSTRLDVVIQTFPNMTGQTFQGVPVPYYPPVPNHVDCGGTTVVYYSDWRAGTAQKLDCPDGELGSIVRYAVPAGAYTSFVSLVDANALAEADVNAHKQAYANDNGFCSLPEGNPPN